MKCIGIGYLRIRDITLTHGVSMTRPTEMGFPHFVGFHPAVNDRAISNGR